jgi:hypothetical protein
LRYRGIGRDDSSGRQKLLTEFSALHPRAAKQLTVLLLRHPLAPLLDY